MNAGLVTSPWPWPPESRFGSAVGAGGRTRPSRARTATRLPVWAAAWVGAEVTGAEHQN